MCQAMCQAKNGLQTRPPGHFLMRRRDVNHTPEKGVQHMNPIDRKYLSPTSMIDSDHCKASLLCALGRACNIPSRVGFADVKNHLATRQLLDFLGSDLFVYHGYVEFFLGNKWVKATPAFNRELCERHHVAPLEFNGLDDSLFQPYNLEQELFMEYVADHGTYADIPVDLIVAAWKSAYGEERVNTWIEGFERSGGSSGRDFYGEEVIKGTN